MSIIDSITDPFQYAFMQRAFIAAGLAAVVCAAVGTFVVEKGLAFMGDAVAHSSLTGMAVFYLLGAAFSGRSGVGYPCLRGHYIREPAG